MRIKNILVPQMVKEQDLSKFFLKKNILVLKKIYTNLFFGTIFKISCGTRSKQFFLKEEHFPIKALQIKAL